MKLTMTTRRTLCAGMLVVAGLMASISTSITHADVPVLPEWVKVDHVYNHHLQMWVTSLHISVPGNAPDANIAFYTDFFRYGDKKFWEDLEGLHGLGQSYLDSLEVNGDITAKQKEEYKIFLAKEIEDFYLE